MAGKIKFLLEEEVRREEMTGGSWGGGAAGGLGTLVIVGKFSNNQPSNLDLLACWCWLALHLEG